MECWVEGADGSGYGVDHLPYGVFAPEGDDFRVGVRIGSSVLDLGPVLDDPMFSLPSLDPFLAHGPSRWAEVRSRLQELLSDSTHSMAVAPHLHALDAVSLKLAWTVGDYVDFYSSREHAENLGRMFRPDSDPLTPNWLHLPIGYHGRGGTVVVSGTEIRRPSGQRKPPSEALPTYGPSQRLDIEAEVGFVVGVPSSLGTPVPVDEAMGHVFGVVLVNDWSARDIQAWEYVPLGPFLGKSFATSVSAWVTPLAALDVARVPAPAQDPSPLDYLRESDRRGLDLALSVSLNGEVISRPSFAGMYWTPAQQLAHLTANGASIRCGDLFASGTVSGPTREERGSLIELSWNGTEPLTLADGSTRAFLEDGDEVVLSAQAGSVSLGEVRGRIVA
ncbi:MAG: fumarylacetoacetase [Frankiales bacterium]|nr:fumarylacetoacetase [Frankiales bacterium]